MLVCWNLFTLLGAVAGDRLGDPRTYGLDAAVGAAFLALLWPRLADTGHRVVAALASVLALALVGLVPAGVPVLAAGGVALLAGVLTRAAPASPDTGAASRPTIPPDHSGGLP